MRGGQQCALWTPFLPTLTLARQALVGGSRLYGATGSFARGACSVLTLILMRPREGQGARTGEPSSCYSPARNPRTELRASWGPSPVQRIPQVLGVLGCGSLTPSREAQGGIDSLMGSLVGPPHPGVTPSVPWGAATWKKKGSAGTPHFLECLCPHLCHLGDAGLEPSYE